MWNELFYDFAGKALMCFNASNMPKLIFKKNLIIVQIFHKCFQGRLFFFLKLFILKGHIENFKVFIYILKGVFFKLEEKVSLVTDLSWG